MLQQILKDMYIAPELLAELDDEQKQTLFFKMRQEQIRRWKEREEKLIGEQIESTPKSDSRKIIKHVNFLMDEDSNPWTWVMGEFPGDLTLEQIYFKYANILESCAETSDTMKSGSETSTKQYEDSSPLKTESVPVNFLENKAITESEDINEQAPNIEKNIPACDTLIANSASQNVTKNSLVYPKIASKESATRKLSEMLYSNIKPAPTHKSVDDILRSSSSQQMRKQDFIRRPSVEEVKAEGKEIFKHWVEQESRAKKMDEERRLVARRIREDNTRLNRKLRTESQIIGFMSDIAITDTINIDIDIDEAPARKSKPSNMDEVVKWYLESEKPKGCLFDSETNKYSSFFHGTIDRRTAEDRLLEEPEGSFLLRLSDKIWGYAVSYKGAIKIRHYLIDALHQGGYQFFGYNHPAHSSIQSFIDFYKTKPLSVMLPERLIRPCVRHQDLTLFVTLK